MEYYYIISWSHTSGNTILDSGQYYYKGSGNPDDVKESIRKELNKAENVVIHIVSRDPISKETYEELTAKTEA